MEALMSEMDNLSNSLESTRHELHNQVITLEKWEEEKDKLVASVRILTFPHEFRLLF